MPTVIHCTDPTDPLVDDFRDLNHSDRRPDLPGGKGLVIAEGLLVVPRLIRSRYPVRAVLGTQAKIDSLLADDALGALLDELGAKVIVVERETLAQIAGFDMHRGLVAAADRAPERSVAEVLENIPAQRSTIMLGEGVGDHENIGSIFRHAAGMSADAVLLGAGCADPLYRRSVRVSMGHVVRVPFAHFDGGFTNWQHGLQQVRDAGYRIVSLTPDPQAATLAQAVADHPRVALLVGAEGPGLTEHAMRATDIRARIPMAPGTDSLNVATAAAIGLYERLRQDWEA